MADLAGLVEFRNMAIGHCAPDDEPRDGSCPVEYWRAREMAERAAAKRAQSQAARHIHQELAQHYAEQVRRGG